MSPTRARTRTRSTGGLIEELSLLVPPRPSFPLLSPPFPSFPLPFPSLSPKVRGADLDGVCGVCLTARPGVGLTNSDRPLTQMIGEAEEEEDKEEDGEDGGEEEEEEEEEEEAGLGAVLQIDTTSHSFETIVTEAGEEIKVVVGSNTANWHRRFPSPGASTTGSTQRHATYPPPYYARVPLGR